MYPSNADPRRNGKQRRDDDLPTAQTSALLALLLFGRSRHSSWTARPSKMGLIGCLVTLVNSQKSEDLSWRIPELAERLLLLRL